MPIADLRKHMFEEKEQKIRYYPNERTSQLTISH